jgi:hypothetical protein
MELGAIDSECAYSYWQTIRMPDVAVFVMTTNVPQVMLHHFGDRG